MSLSKQSYSEKIQILHSQIEQYRYIDTAKEYKFADTLYNLATENNDQENIAYALLRKSDDFIAHENFAIAYTFISDANQIAKNINSKNLLIKSYTSFANMYNCIGDIHETMEYVLEAYKIVIQPDSKYPEAYIINKMGAIFLQQGSYTKASAFFEQAITKLFSTPDKGTNKLEHLSFLYSNLFFSLFKKGSFKEAIAYHKKRSEYLPKTSLIANLYYQFEKAYIYNYTNESDKLRKQTTFILESINPNSFYIYNTFETLNHFFTILYFTNDKDLIWQGIQKMKTVLSNQTLLPIKILFTKNVIKYLKKYEPENHTSIISEYEKIEKLREKRDLQIDSFNSHEMELQIKAAERQMQYEQTLKEKEMYQAMYNQDSSTGLLNRRGLTEAFAQIYKRRKTSSTIGLIILDIDCFKQYNDNYGHLKGDTAISSLATALHENAIEGFVPARFGGDEFVCLAENKTDNDIAAYIKAIQKDLAAKKIAHDYSTVDNPYVTASIGFCNEPLCESTSLEMLIYKSDIALYEAKRAGKNRIVGSPYTDKITN